MYQLFVGEIGYDRREFLYDLKLWEIRAIVRGFRLRSRTAWESTRMAAYFIMSSMTDLQKAGIHRDTDLVRFPWEKEKEADVSDEDIEHLRELVRKENEAEAKT